MREIALYFFIEMFGFKTVWNRFTEYQWKQNIFNNII